ncbi:MAG: TlpA disulfide reductase family protein [Bacteroidota bacterium]
MTIRHVLSCFICFLFALGGLLGQQFPDVTVKTLNRQSAQLSQYVGQGKTTVVAVWSTTCANCIMELDNMKQYVEKWASEYNAEVVAVSQDQYDRVRRVRPLVSGRQWPYTVLIDDQRQLGELLNFKAIPQLFVVNGNGQIVKQYSAYRVGREEEVDQVLATLK